MPRVKLDHIVVTVEELLEQLELMRDDGMRFVELSIAPPQDDDGEMLPARLDLSAVEDPEAPMLTDYDSIDAADVHIDALGN